MAIFGGRETAEEASLAVKTLGLATEGVWDKGIESWAAEGLPLVRDVTADDLYQRREHFVVVDIREPYEHQRGVVPGAVLLPMRQLPERVGDLDVEKDYALICQSGNRSQSMSVWLALQGFRVANVLDGMNGWMQAGYAIARPQ
jgi:rhodanese-related sulfurtransferase